MGLGTLLEQLRLQLHFKRVLGELRERDVSGLAAPERGMRERLIGELERYAKRGVFPRNPDFAEPTPYFVDASGTRCAMAHLIDATGEHAFVDSVREQRNNAYVRELANAKATGRALASWLAAAGLTAKEAARIQPEYCFEKKADVCFCYLEQPSAGVVIASAMDVGLDRVTAMVQVVHGETGTATVGQSIVVGSPNGAQPGDSLFVPVTIDPQQGTIFGFPFRLDGNNLMLDCHVSVPALSTEDAIAAVMKAQEQCGPYLASRDSAWGESQCEGNEGNVHDDGGCSASGGSPLAIGAVLAAALWTRRRRPAMTRR